MECSGKGARRQFSSVALKVSDRGQPRAVAARLQARLGEAGTVRQNEFLLSARAEAASVRLVFASAGALAMLVAGFILLNVASMSLAERMHRLGILRAVLPNVMASVIVLAALNVASTIIAEAALSFLGLGVQPPVITWGQMLADGRDHITSSWWLATFPGLAITITVLGVIFLGDWVRDVLDPRLR